MLMRTSLLQQHLEPAMMAGGGRVRRVPRPAQQGVVLFVALIVLVVMALTGLAMIRQSGTGLSIAGNLGMRQNALSGAEVATAWWQPKVVQDTTLNSDDLANGYFSDWGGGATDPTGLRLTGDPSKYDWSSSGHSVLATANDGSGNAVRYIVERMCKLAGTDAYAAGQQCVLTQVPSGADKGGTCADYAVGGAICNPQLTVFYRISSQVTGPRNSVSYIQVMVIPSS
jgi:Tfp pilus assembly protein PilX